MGVLIFPLAAVIARLEGVPEIALVGNAGGLSEALETPPRKTPAVFVLAETQGGPISFNGTPVQQDRTTAVKFVVWVRNHGGAAKASAEMDAVLAAIDQQMTGWSPGGDAFSAMQFVANRDEFEYGAALVNQAVFECNWNFSATPIV